MVVARGVPGAVNIYLDDDAGIGAQTKQVECYVGASRSCIKKNTDTRVVYTLYATFTCDGFSPGVWE